jgi:hypothetical protein
MVERGAQASSFPPPRLGEADGSDIPANGGASLSTTLRVVPLSHKGEETVGATASDIGVEA